jgi:hypothetical protein
MELLGILRNFLDATNHCYFGRCVRTIRRIVAYQLFRRNGFLKENPVETRRANFAKGINIKARRLNTSKQFQ